MDYSSLTDEQFETLRREPKVIENPQAHERRKQGHMERNYQLLAVNDELRRYRIFWRQSVFQSGSFSVGLGICLPAGGLSVLVRYNGPSHAHRNKLEGTSFSGTCHRHTAVRRYADAGLRADAYAEVDSRYDDIEGAMRCMIFDCGISGVSLTPQQIKLI